ncbi:helix-turn-helix transcriptional regulator [Arthrobacter rhombi]|uniref:helix-turn-helix transcriptional regulator n=1 Tax=Arthrobacter rhombi TaxID=71253 RepID=UPI0031CE27AF
MMEDRMQVAMHRLMTMDEVSEETRIPVNTLRFYRHKGTGPKSAKIGGKVMYRREDLDKWINQAFEAGQAS